MRVFLVAGEPSGDRLGGALMAGLRQLVPEVRFDGIGGDEMQAQGLVSRFPMDELSVMGVAEVLPKYFHLKRRIAETARAVIETAPDVLITIDSPDFCLRVAGLVKAETRIRTVHYVAPSVWAWRPKRADRMARVIDHVLALLPFEPPYMQAAGMDCDFVGHPVVAEPVATAQEVDAFRVRHGLGDAPVLLVLPGSRRGEVGKLAPVFGAALAPVLAARPDLRLVVPAAAPVAAMVRQMTADWPGAPLILDPRDTDAAAAQADKRAAFAAASVALAASGTVALELAAADTPMVMAYKVNWLTWQLVRPMMRIDTANLVNLVSETRLVPECLGPDCRPDLIAAAVLGVLERPEAQKEAMALTMERLGLRGEAPGLRAARAVLKGMGQG
ncbi:lipid-A-disaccharide synthase [Antarcticimicrobium luteum]|uniref:Lipid-A-disaccharide synthase n=1 Tax=Antarcticimicrobium luteum TaxID=2547397 RepID=A0A4R5V6G1_9RHOB|nr:lipid-A-disaccharide synthase [Antarcticimicrobium luteum]TDK47391.1 lipid-A-disaccharide synthase [Antarcticimicrobium luteum]